MESFTILTFALLRKAQLKIASCLPFCFSVSIVKNYKGLFTFKLYGFFL